MGQRRVVGAAAALLVVLAGLMGCERRKETQTVTGPFVFSVPAAARGRMIAADGSIYVSLDERPLQGQPIPPGHADRAGVAAFDARSGARRWSRMGLPALAAVTPRGVFAWSRAGLLVSLDLQGRERFRVVLPDDRTASGQQRGDRDGPFAADLLADVMAGVTADVVIDGGQRSPAPAGAGASLLVAARDQVLRLSAEDGSVLARAVVCGGAQAAVARIALGADRTIWATCTFRTDWDDERRPLADGLWDSTAPLAARRTSPGDLVALSPELREHHRVRAALDEPLYGDHAPLALPDGDVILCGAGTRRDPHGGRQATLDTWLLRVHGASGALRWRAPLRSAAPYEPALTPEGVVAGGEPTLYGLSDGKELWTARGLRVAHRPLLLGAQLLVNSDGRLLTIDRDGGAVRPTALQKVALTAGLVAASDLVYGGFASGDSAVRLCAFSLTTASSRAGAR